MIITTADLVKVFFRRLAPGSIKMKRASARWHLGGAMQRLACRSDEEKE